MSAAVIPLDPARRRRTPTPAAEDAGQPVQSYDSIDENIDDQLRAIDYLETLGDRALFVPWTEIAFTVGRLRSLTYGVRDAVHAAGLG